MNVISIKKDRTKRYGIILTIISIFLIPSILISCTGGAVYQGWSGVAVNGNSLYIGSMNSKLIGLDATKRSRLFNDISLAVSSSGGFFSSCGPSTSYMYLYGTPCIADNMIFITTYSGKVFAFDTEKAIQQWSYPEKGYISSIVGGAFFHDSKVFFGSNDGKVYAINADAGQLNSPSTVWSTPFATGNKIWATPTASSDTLFIGSFDKNMYAINIKDGTEKWHFTTKGAIINTPIIKDGIVYFGSFDRYFYAVNAETGQLVWKSTSAAEKWFWANPVFIDDTIYAPNIDGKVYSFNISSGVMDKIDISTSPIASSPVVIGNNIFIATEDTNLWILHTTDNNVEKFTEKPLNTSKKKIYAPLSTDGSVIYVITTNNDLFAVNADNGVVLWNFNLTGN